MIKRVDKLAGKFATAMLEQAGVSKSAGSVAEVMPYATGLAEAVVTMEKALKQAVRQAEDVQRRIGALVDANGERINRLADSYAAATGTVRPVTEIQQGMVDLDLQKFRTGLVPTEAPKMNGHHHQEDGPVLGTPLWHPEHPEGGL